MTRHGGGASGQTVLLIAIVAVGAAGFLAYSSGLLSQWTARLRPSPAASPAVVPPIEAPQVPSANSNQPEDAGPKSIFDVPGSGGGRSSAPTGTVQTPSSPSPIASPNPTAPKFAPPSAPPPPDLNAARAKLASATSKVELFLAADPIYQKLKSQVNTAEAKRKAALAESGPGSPEVLSASQEWLDAKTALRRKFESAADVDPAFQAAKRELSDAQKGSR